MNRLLTCILSGAAFLAVSTASALAARPAKPNILHIHADDHRPDGLHALGNDVLRTPNLDTLVEQGFTFTHCYTQGSTIGAVCLPSRTMMLTGRSLLRIPGRKTEKADVPIALPTRIKAAGYETWHCGKSGNEYGAGIQAFDTNLVMNDSTAVLRRGSSERHADAAIKFLNERDRSRPFYIYLAPPVPHDPRVTAPEFHKYRSGMCVVWTGRLLQNEARRCAGGSHHHPGMDAPVHPGFGSGDRHWRPAFAQQHCST